MHADEILEQVGDAERAASGEFSVPRGELVVTAPIVFGRLHVLPVVNAFLARFPEIDVRLVLSDRNLHLIDDHIDVAVRIGALADSNMVATRVGTVRSVVCGSPAYFAAHGEPKTPADLSDLACVTFGMFGSHGSWTFATPPSKAQQAVSVRSRLSVNTAEAALDACMAGVGVTRVLSYQAARGVKEGTLKIVLTDFEGDPLPVSLVQAGWGRIPLKTRTFLDMAVPRLRSALARHLVNKIQRLVPRSERALIVAEGPSLLRSGR